ncbi:hypothetical protein C7974DRAFT_397224 [Boeremia exigua]|uniref:uncharacterized protein n=1 Tax=Boeremia exigua TaxID=749465 RepID=UPI001E8E6AF6|nr:uncharacterized protein C7974DRAFT_397224 [Boeremia exigua]KAH6621834.1 hypothetical protein C7974DRAFT_397224 [Boeremia exigua]
MSEVFGESPCHLVSLPGELRNRIYDYCIESGPITLPLTLHGYAHSRPYFGGLRHVSRSLYVEFTPIYLDRTIVSLSPSDVERYLSVIYPKHEAPSTDKFAVGGLGTNIHGHIRINLRLSEVLDLTPFAGLLSRAPNIRIEFARSSAISAVVWDVVVLLRKIMHASCPIDFEKTVERILFRYSLRSEVVIKLHRNVPLEKMFDDAMRHSPRQWLVRQGLPVLGHLKVVLESSEKVLRDPPIGKPYGPPELTEVNSKA